MKFDNDFSHHEKSEILSKLITLENISDGNILSPVKSSCPKKVILGSLTKPLETNGCVISTVATDALVLKHQAISMHSAE